MKNSNLNFLIFLFCITVFISCEKEENDIIINPKEAITVQDGELHFSSIEAYENMIEHNLLTKENLENSLGDSYQKFTSLDNKLKRVTKNKEEKHSLYGFDSDQESPIFNILNQNDMITIGEWTFMIDFANEVVGVIDARKTFLKSALKNKDYNSDSVLWFSTEDDVLLLLEAGNRGTLTSVGVKKKVANHKAALEENMTKMSAICNLNTDIDSSTNALKDKKTVFSEAQCGSGTVTTVQIPIFDQDGNITGYRTETIVDCKRWLADAKHVYQKAGIYFSLQSKIKYRGNVSCFSNAPSAINTQLTARVNYTYKRRKRFRRKKEEKSGSKSDASFNNELSIRSYEGSRSLKTYTLNTTFTYERKDNCSDFCTVSNNVVTIVMPEIAD
ncbi:hypothetical protein NBT05_16580 [Aquimarina sp. ERC-38]|uniref:hypothetical protein n=1 Tax=Aquimarina sp. ERC-38 TaxID=2949996 RepID=UPI0022482770|nr:hypothetical protein [Aquimarina sp. ERC-38]UZO80548.1 hypothetical protein NBT05_16580 [Aquimarina sp. ERC-38]